MKTNYDIVVLGDINLDYHLKTPFSFKFTDLTENGIIWWGDIEEIPGGSGLNMCRFAQEFGYKTFLFSKIGDDASGKVVSDWLNYKNIEYIKDIVAPDFQTGKALIMRDNANIRLLVNNISNANHSLRPEDITSNSEKIINSTLLYISGYCISEKGSTRLEATRTAIHMAKSAGNKVNIAFDVVPHRIYDQYSFNDFYNLTRDVDILISEVSTLRRFLGLGSKMEIIDRQLAEETILAIKPYYSKVLLRFGPSGCDEQVLWDNKKPKIRFESTGHAQATDKRGFGDKLAVMAFRDFFSALPIK